MQLADPVTRHFRLVETQKRALKKLGIETIDDLLAHFPTRYENISGVKPISELAEGDSAVVYGRISKLETRKAWKRKTPLAEGVVEDASGKIKIIWFNQPYLAKMIPEGAPVKVAGKVTGSAGRLYFANPEVEQLQGTLPVDVGEALFGDSSEALLYPIYPESRGITSKWFYHAIERVFASGVLEEITDPIPQEILERYHLPTRRAALHWIHTPKREGDHVAARKRFAFEEVFFIQLAKQQERRAYCEHDAFVVAADRNNVAEFVERFPFEPTDAQRRAIEEILRDFEKGVAMARLLEGDVGSGKTAVAATTAYAIATTHPAGQDFGNLQVAYMAPTEILAKQHFESFIEYFKHLPVNIGLITSSRCKKFPSKVRPDAATDISRAQLLKWAANGEIPILIGTHALIQKSVKFENLAYAIIDEQHRFGTHQRFALARGSTQMESTPQIPADADDGLLYKDLSYTVRNCAFTIHNELGHGHKESVYQNALEQEFKKRDIRYSREAQIPIHYRNKKVGIYQPDFLIDDKIIIELKALPRLGSGEKKQLWNYLKGTEYKLAFLLNFGTPKVESERIVLDSARRKNLRTSATAEGGNPRGSAQKVRYPHFLSMTATPIPRTLALTIYGDLDLTLLDEMPAGRKPVITEIVLPKQRGETYEKIRAELAAGRQAYVICPRIDEPDPTKEQALNVKSVKEEAKRLKKDVFPEYEIGILHSKLTPKEKEETMQRFLDNEIRILVATSVVEVGVNVPNATVIVIEGAERFGLAQLHQLRGRVLRSTHQAHCFAFAETRGEHTLARLKALKTAKNGFELAEHDLELRGPGELSGGRQWGISDIGMEAIKNIKMVEAARDEAQKLIAADPTLQNYPLLQALATQKVDQLHFE